MRWLWRQSAHWTLVSALLRERAVVLSLLVFSIVYLAFSVFGVSIWGCAWKMVTGWRCPGCGLTSGCKAMLKGHFAEGMTLNWFSPFVLFGLLLVPVVMALPKTQRESVVRGIEVFEKKTRLVLLFFVVVIAQTVARLAGWA